MSDLAAFLATLPPFGALDAGERAALAARCRERTLPAGARLLAQGARNQTLFLLRSGQVAIRARQGGRVETIARVSPPAVLGEISFLTGRTCSADVDVLVDAVVIELPLDALASLPESHERVVRGLAGVLADRLHSVVAGGNEPLPTPIVLVQAGDRWTARGAFAIEMARALAHETGGDALLVRLGGAGAGPDPVPREPGVAVVGLPAEPGAARAGAAARLPEWTSRFTAVVVTQDAGQPSELESLSPFATHVCRLFGPGDPVPDAVDPATPGPTAGQPVVLVAQDARSPTLAVLDGTHRLVPDVADAESASNAGRPASAAFRASVASFARAVLRIQVGVALGAGGARGWCHAGVLAALSGAALPIDVIAGTSMGAVVGALWAGGASLETLQAAAEEWRRRRRRLREWRVWRMHMASERQLDALFVHYFGNGRVNAMPLPFWANAADIERGEEVVLRSGLIRDVARASMAFPGWTPPVLLDGRLLVDGAVVDPAPAQAVRDMGAAFVVTVLAVGPYAAQPLAPRFPRRAYDLFARAFQLSGIAMGLTRSEAASDVILVPELGDATMLSFDRDRELIAAGRRSAEAQLPAILEAHARLTQARRRAARVPSP